MNVVNLVRKALCNLHPGKKLETQKYWQHFTIAEDKIVDV